MGAFGADADDLPAGHTRLSRQHFGAVTLDLVQVGGPRVVADLRAELEGARVERVHPDGRAEACDFWDGSRWHCGLRRTPDATRACLARSTAERHRDRQRDPHCGLDPWVYVGRDVRVIGGHARRCLWLHPMDRVAVTVHWPAAEAAAGDTLVVDYGFTDQVTVDHDRPATRTRPATLAVHRSDGPALDTWTAEPVFGYFRREVVLGEGGGPLRLVARTSQMVDAHLCIDATVRRSTR
jgi:hypothetical protein